MKAWCQSVFLIMCTHTHTKTNTCLSNNFLLQQRAWESMAAVTWACDLGSLWQRSPWADGFSQTLCIIILSATLYLPVSFQFLGVSLYLGHQNRRADWPFPKRFPILFLMPVMLHLVSLSPSSASLPTLCPSWCSLGLLVSGSLRLLKTDSVQEHLALQLVHTT